MKTLLKISLVVLCCCALLVVSNDTGAEKKRSDEVPNFKVLRTQWNNGLGLIGENLGIIQKEVKAAEKKYPALTASFELLLGYVTLFANRDLGDIRFGPDLGPFPPEIKLWQFFCDDPEDFKLGKCPPPEHLIEGIYDGRILPPSCESVAARQAEILTAIATSTDPNEIAVLLEEYEANQDWLDGMNCRSDDCAAMQSRVDEINTKLLDQSTSPEEIVQLITEKLVLLEAMAAAGC